MPHRPSWFRDGEVFVSSAATVGINKDGDDLHEVDLETGERNQTRIDDQLAIDVGAILEGEFTDSSTYIDLAELSDSWVWVPTYFDDKPSSEFQEFVKKNLPTWTSSSLGELIEAGLLIRRDGHGSPSVDQRVGTVPYIKVSDLRAGLVNINPTNRIPQALAESQFWRGQVSGMKAWDLLSPERASKNIGDFSVLLPGQEQIVLTREVIVLRVTEDALFDSFFLLWALTLKVVRRQWNRITFMQTNREDVGHRYREIRIPVPPSKEAALEVSEPFREYFTGLAELRSNFGTYLSESNLHHIFIDTASE